MMAIVLAMALLSLLLKVLPLGFASAQHSQWGWAVKAVDYAVCFIIGTIIVNVALSGATVSQMISTPSARHLAAILTLLLAYGVCKRTGSILKSLFVALAFFTVFIGVLS